MAANKSNNWSGKLHEAQGSGSGSRMCMNFSKLEEAGWTIILHK